LNAAASLQESIRFVGKLVPEDFPGALKASSVLAAAATALLTQLEQQPDALEIDELNSIMEQGLHSTTQQPSL
jgi:hypothetical protein